MKVSSMYKIEVLATDALFAHGKNIVDNYMVINEVFDDWYDSQLEKDPDREGLFEYFDYLLSSADVKVVFPARL